MKFVGARQVCTKGGAERLFARRCYAGALFAVELTSRQGGATQEGR